MLICDFFFIFPFFYCPFGKEQDLKDSPAAAAVVPTIPLTSSSNALMAFQERQPLSKMVSLKIAGDQDKWIIEGAGLLLACSAILHQDGLEGKHIELAWWRREKKLSDRYILYN